MPRPTMPLLALVLCVVVCATAMDDQARQRQDKIESILRIQDRRSIHDGRLPALMGDRDPVVRRRAVLACASLQDSTLIGLLTAALSDRDQQVVENAAFALGQTGSLLSERSKRDLEEDLLWKRLPLMRTPGRLIEEFGRFGTREGLRDLMIRVGNTASAAETRPVTMAIARFAIRKITDDDAVRFCLKQIRPTDLAPWEAVYALQRMGDLPAIREDLENLALLTRHPSPLVRMHLASLLGKVADDRVGFEPVIRMAEYDKDWRVRVNALKALPSFPARDRERVAELCRRLLYDGNIHIATTSLQTIRAWWRRDADTSANAHRLASAIRRIAENSDREYQWQIQGEALLTYAGIARPSDYGSLAPPVLPYPRLRAMYVEGLAIAGSPGAEQTIVAASESEEAQVAVAGIQALRSLARVAADDAVRFGNLRRSILAGLARDDVAVRGTAAEVLRDSVLLHDGSTEPLLTALHDCRLPDDLEAMQEIMTTLGARGDTRAVLPLVDYLRQPDRVIQQAAATALQQLTGTDYTGQMRRDVEPLSVDYDFEYLRSLPDTVRVRISTARGDIDAELYTGIAPFTVMNFLKLAVQRGFFRGIVFHRVVPNFVVQGGDPRGDGWGGPGHAIRSEFTLLEFGTGILGMASAGKDTEGSQWFITHSPQPHLDGRYTAFGRVVRGQHNVDKLQIEDRIFDVTRTDAK